MDETGAADGAAAAWVAAVRELGGADGSAAVEAAAELSRRWAEPHRHYHTTAHLRAVLRDAFWLAGEVGLPSRDRALVTLAACAHDVVYEGRPGEDERASAAWARSRLAACGVEQDVPERVAQLVLATVDHRAEEGDRAAAVLLDADLAVLGSPPEDYARYLAAVRAEYAGLAEDEWRAGRASVVASLLARDPLYLTEPARSRWGGRARENLEAELADLRVPPRGT